MMWCVPQPLLSLPELRVLYLHSNKIESLKEVRQLGSLGSLHKLTMHGNPIDEKKGYRCVRRPPPRPDHASRPKPRSPTDGPAVSVCLSGRCIVLHLIPTLSVLDFSVVTNQDRQKARLWSQLNNKALARLEGGKQPAPTEEKY